MQLLQDNVWLSHARAAAAARISAPPHYYSHVTPVIVLILLLNDLPPPPLKGDHHRGCAGHGYDTDGAVGGGRVFFFCARRVLLQLVCCCGVCGGEVRGLLHSGWCVLLHGMHYCNVCIITLYVGPTNDNTLCILSYCIPNYTTLQAPCHLLELARKKK